MRQNIPEFPNSKKLVLNDKAEIENLTRQFPPYSDYNFTSLYCYDVNERIKVSWLNGNLVVLFQDYMSDAMFYSFLGNNQVGATALTLLKHCATVGLDARLALIPECVAKMLEGFDGLEVHEDRDNHDHILSVNDLATFKGNKFYDKRNLVNRFSKQNPDHTVRHLALEQSETKQHIIDLFQIWAARKLEDRNSTAHALQALKRLLDAVERFEVMGLGVFVHDQLCAFSLQEMVDEQYALVHFEYGDITYDGITSVIRQASAKYLAEQGRVYINFEQDLGIPGLRKAKALWRPTSYLKKYIVRKQEVSVSAGYDKLASEYRVMIDNYLPNYVEDYTFSSILGDVSGKSVLDVGCGTGASTRLIKRLGAARVVGMDISSEMLKEAQGEEHQQPLGIEYIQGDMFAPANLGRFDLVSAFGSLTSSPTRDHLHKTAEMIFNNLKAGGRLVASFYEPQPPQVSQRLEKYGVTFAMPEPLQEGDAFNLIVRTASQPLTFQDYYYHRTTYEWAFRTAGFQEIRWHCPMVSPEGLQEFGEGFWQDYIEYQMSIYLECVKG